MGREYGVESGTGNPQGGIQPATKFYLVGAPGTGKQKIAEALAEEFEPKLSWRGNYKTSHVLGTVADYRVELALALDRWNAGLTDTPTVYTHSLLDNLAYITYAFSRYQLGSVSIGTTERAILTMTIIGTIVADSFTYDEIFFLEGDFDPNEDYDQYQLQTILQMILDEGEINYHIIPADENAADKIADVLKGHLG